MTENNRIKAKLQNIEGKKSLELNKLQYTMEIINGIGIDPSILPELLGELELTEEDFFAHLSGNIPTNISLYDQTLQLVTEKQQDKLPKKIK